MRERGSGRGPRNEQTENTTWRHECRNRSTRRTKPLLQAFGILFNERDYARAQRFWSPQYIHHSNHIPPGREGLFELVRNAPATMRYENRLILANGDFLMLHGRFSGLGAGTPNWIVVDIVRLENGVLAEHWDVIQDEATRAASKSGLPMFGDKFPDE